MLPDDQPGAGDLRHRGHPDQGRRHQQRQSGHGWQWQTLFYNERYSNTDLDSRRILDFAKLAEAYGCLGLRCDTAADVDATIEKAMAVDDRPVVIDFWVHRDAMVWPMVPAGTGNDDIQIARGMAPDWDREDRGRR